MRNREVCAGRQGRLRSLYGRIMAIHAVLQAALIRDHFCYRFEVLKKKQGNGTKCTMKGKALRMR